MPVEPDYRQALLVRHPFWEELSPTVAKRRIEQLLAAPDSAALVQALPPVEYTVLLKEAPDMRPLLLALAHPEQVRTVLDLDCWDKDTLLSTRVLAWLEELQRSGEEVCVQALHALDAEMLIATFRQHVRVHAALPIEEEEEPRHYDEVLANELYRLEFIDAESPWNERALRFLNFLRLVDLDLYHSLMQGIMWGQDSDLAEWAYRWKSGRLQDEGFPEYYEALETYYRVADVEPLLPTAPDALPSPGPPASAEESGLVPSYAWSMTPSGSLLAQALREDFAPATLELLCWEMVSL
jgi:hypothetical protein